MNETCKSRIVTPGLYYYNCTRHKGHIGNHMCVPDRGPIREWTDKEALDWSRTNPEQPTEIKECA